MTPVSRTRHSEVALNAHRPRLGRAGGLRELFCKQIATLRRDGHMTARRVLVLRTEAGE